MYCKQCGKKLESDARFCSVCGEKIESTLEEIVFNPPFESDPEFIWDLYEFPESKKTEDIEFFWGKPEKPGKLEKSQKEEQKESDGAIDIDLFESIKKETERYSANQNSERPEQEEKINKFYTFNRKNEEFQKLLDKEYEKIQMGVIEKPIPVEEEPLPIKEPTAVSEAHVQFDDREERIIFDNDTLSQKFDTQELKKDIIESALERAGVRVEYQSDFRPKFLEEFENENLIAEETQEPAMSEEPPMPEEPTASEEITAPEEMDLEPEQPIPLTASDIEFKKEAFSALEELWDSQESKPKKTQKAEAEKKDDDNKKNGNGIGKVFLILIIILLMVEIIILGIRYIAPESKAANIINEKLNFAVSWFMPADKKDAEDPAMVQQEELQEEEPQELHVNLEIPETNKDVLIQGQLGNNKNIVRIEANDSLAYDPSKDYGIADLNESKPIENNIWFTEDGGNTYYDQSLVATLIKFDSMWVDYVNNQDKSVLEIVKEGSKAYKNIIKFPSAGKTETFELLQIGEIRQGKNGFYVWAHEEIQITEKGKTTDKQYNYIYHIEPDSNQMYIVNYYLF